MRAGSERPEPEAEGLKRKTSVEYLFITSPLVWLQHSARAAKTMFTALGFSNNTVSSVFYKRL